MAAPKSNALTHHKTPQKRPSAAQVEDAIRKAAALPQARPFGVYTVVNGRAIMATSGSE